MNIPLDILKIVASYLVKPKMKLLDWILLDKLDWDWLSGNPNAIHLLEQNMDKIEWLFLSENPNAIHLLEKNIHKIIWTYLPANPNAIHLLLKCKTCDNVWNRDVNSATNIYRIAKNAINGIERPTYLCREKKDENIKVDNPKPKKEKVRKVVQKKANKSVRVVALTKS